MATNGKVKFLYNMITGSTTPLIMHGLFDAGSTTAIKEGEILERTGSGNTVWVPWDSDYDATGNDDAICVSACEIKAGDRAGYYPIIVPRPGDVFEAELASASALALGTALTYSTSQKVTTGGTYPIGYACGMDHYPTNQGHLADDASPDAGVTVKSTSYAQFIFYSAVSYFKEFNI